MVVVEPVVVGLPLQSPLVLSSSSFVRQCAGPFFFFEDLLVFTGPLKEEEESNLIILKRQV